MLRTKKHLTPFLFGIGACVLIPSSTTATPVRPAEIQVIDITSKQVEQHWLAFPSSYTGGTEIAMGDLGGDGVAEYIIAQTGGEDARGRIRTFRSDRSLITEFIAFPEGVMGQEMDIAVGDVDNDGKEEILASLPYGRSSVVHIFQGNGEFDNETVGAFEAFPGEQHGVSIAVGNVAGDAKKEILVGTGFGVAPRIRVLNTQGVPVAPDIIPFSEDTTVGVSLATLDTNGDGQQAVAVGLLNGGKTNVKLYRISAEGEHPVLADFSAWSRELRSGVEMAGVDVDADGTEELLVAPMGDQQAEVRLFREDGTRVELPELFVYEEDFRGGVHVSAQEGNVRTAPKLVVSPRVQRQRGDTARGEKYIEVDLSEQIEYVWEDAYLRQVYLISSGLPGTPTPPGEWSVLKKIENHTYDGRPYYFFPNTQWNLRFKNGDTNRNYYIHTAYWHNNFGKPMSHGCVNMREEEAKFVYEWADVGTPVWIHE